MKKIIEVVAVCPLLGGKPCINDGITREVLITHKTANACMFWDGDQSYNGISPGEPCRLKRAINRILSHEIDTINDGISPEMPWETKKGGAEHAKKEQA